MKTLKQLFFIAVLAIIAVSCSSDDNNNDNNNSQTVEQMLMSGKWYWEKIEGNDLTSCEKTSFIHFYGENRFSFVEYYSFNDVDCVIADNSSGTFELISDTLIRVIDSETSETLEHQIISISTDELILRMDNGYTYTFDKTEG